MDPGHPLTITSWNVEGFYGTLWKKIIKRWITEQPCVLDILCLQEIKADGLHLDEALWMILLDNLVVILLLVQGNGGTTTLVHPSITIEDSRNFMRGRVSWVIVT